MPIKTNKFTPCLSFKTKALEAAKFYTSIFKNSKITHVSYYGELVSKASGAPKGSVLTVHFELEGQKFVALNGPDFAFSEGTSFMVPCKDQKELDYVWNRLTAGGDKKAQMCGWLKDKFGVSWQVYPAIMDKVLNEKNSERLDRVLAVLNGMKKLNVKAIEKAYHSVK